MLRFAEEERNELAEEKKELISRTSWACLKKDGAHEVFFVC